MKSRLITRVLFVILGLSTGLSVFASDNTKETRYTSPVYVSFTDGVIRADQDLRMHVQIDNPTGVAFTANPVDGKNNNGISTEVRTGATKDGKVDVDIIIRGGGNTNPGNTPVHGEVVKVKIFDIEYITVDNISGVYGSQPTGPTGVTAAKITEIVDNDDPSTAIVIGQFQIEVHPVTEAIVRKNVSEVTLYPNPVRDGNLNLAFADADVNVSLVTVHNAVGALVYQTRPASAGQRIEINLDNLNSGIYFVRVETANGEIVRKFNITR